jgi:hypothetical protein
MSENVSPAIIPGNRERPFGERILKLSESYWFAGLKRLFIGAWPSFWDTRPVLVHAWTDCHYEQCVLPVIEL